MRGQDLNADALRTIQPVKQTSSDNSHSNSSASQRVGRFAIGVSDNQSVYDGQDLFDESDSESFSLPAKKKTAKSNSSSHVAAS